MENWVSRLGWRIRARIIVFIVVGLIFMGIGLLNSYHDSQTSQQFDQTRAAKQNAAADQFGSAAVKLCDHPAAPARDLPLLPNAKLAVIDTLTKAISEDFAKAIPVAWQATSAADITHIVCVEDVFTVWAKDEYADSSGAVKYYCKHTRIDDKIYVLDVKSGQPLRYRLFMGNQNEGPLGCPSVLSMDWSAFGERPVPAVVQAWLVPESGVFPTATPAQFIRANTTAS